MLFAYFSWGVVAIINPDTGAIVRAIQMTEDLDVKYNVFKGSITYDSFNDRIYLGLGGSKNYSEFYWNIIRFDVDLNILKEI